MEKWEEEGFASEEAYNRHQQTVKELQEAKEKLSIQVSEKQKVIDGNRTKISELADKEKEFEALKEAEAERKKKEEEAEAERKRKEEENAVPTADKNKQRIDNLPKDKRDTLAKEYEAATPEQKELLTDPEKMAAFLDLKLGDEPTSTNPFDMKPATPTKTVTEQVAEAFGMVDNQGPPSPDRSGSGFIPSDRVVTAKEKSEEAIEKARQSLLN
jgi:hypothetical protein